MPYPISFPMSNNGAGQAVYSIQKLRLRSCKLEAGTGQNLGELGELEKSWELDRPAGYCIQFYFLASWNCILYTDAPHKLEAASTPRERARNFYLLIFVQDIVSHKWRLRKILLRKAAISSMKSGIQGSWKIGFSVVVEKVSTTPNFPKFFQKNFFQIFDFM